MENYLALTAIKLTLWERNVTHTTIYSLKFLQISRMRNDDIYFFVCVAIYALLMFMVSADM